MVLYGLLVMVLSAAGFYYFTTSPTPPAAEKRPAPAKQTLAMPERPAPSAEAVVPPGEPVPVAPAKPLVEAEIPKGTLREVLPTEPPPAPAVEEAQLAVPEPPAVAPAAVPAAPEKASPAVAAAREKTPAVAKAPAASGKYSIQAGAFVDQVNRDEALAKIGQLGFEGTVVPVKKIMPMTRLLIGVYGPEEAKRKAAELAKIDSAVFYLHRGDQMALYAGSFYEIGKARQFAADLLAKGIAVEEEKTEVELTLSRLKFGSFPDLATAEKVAKRARQIGLEAAIIRNGR
jgi:DedD protein